MKKVLISTSSVGKKALERLEQAGLTPEVNPHGRKLEEAEAIALLQGKVGVVAGVEKLSKTVLSACPGLQVISRCGVGMDSVDLPAAESLGIKVLNTPNAHVDAVAELTLAGILTALRRIPVADRSIRSGGWKKPMGALLRGKTLGVVGLGRVGKRLLELTAPFEVKVVAFDPVRDAAASEKWSIEWLGLEELFARADVISLHLPFTPETKGLIGSSLLGIMKSTAVLVNTARGGVVDETALLEALKAKPEACAYLDVFDKEPYTGPLSQVDNAILTSHVGSYAAEARETMELEAVDNLIRALQQN